MPVISTKLGLYYYDVPKIASTSLKRLFWEVENGAAYDPQDGNRGEKKTPIHAREGFLTRSWKAADPPPEGMETLVLLRDPVDRLLSAWENKICKRVFAKREELEELSNECLPYNPDFGTFIDQFELYREVSRPARIHTHAYAWHLGPSIDFFDHVFTLENTKGLANFLSDRANRTLSLPHRNAAQKSSRDSTLGKLQVDRLERLVVADYAWLGGLYDIDKSLSRFR